MFLLPGSDDPEDRSPVAMKIEPDCAVDRTAGMDVFVLSGSSCVELQDRRLVRSGGHGMTDAPNPIYPEDTLPRRTAWRLLSILAETVRIKPTP